MRLLRPNEAAERLACSRSAIYALIRTGTLPHVRLSAGIVRIPEDELEAFLRARMQGGSRARSR
jgi:excisionase family DNA binding protein